MMRFDCGMIRRVAAGLLAAGVLGAGSAQGNLIVNGDFETGDFTGWTGGTRYTIVSPFVRESSSYAANFGAVDSVEWISQSLSTTPKATYLLAFDLRNMDGPNNEFDVTIDGNTIGTSIDGNTTMPLVNVGAFDLTHFEFQFRASGDTTTIAFGGMQQPANWYLDNVAVTSVPEPTCLCIIGVTAGLLLSRRRAVRS